MPADPGAIHEIWGRAERWRRTSGRRWWFFSALTFGLTVGCAILVHLLILGAYLVGPPKVLINVLGLVGAMAMALALVGLGGWIVTLPASLKAKRALEGALGQSLGPPARDAGRAILEQVQVPGFDRALRASRLVAKLSALVCLVAAIALVAFPAPGDFVVPILVAALAGIGVPLAVSRTASLSITYMVSVQNRLNASFKGGKEGPLDDKA